MPPGHCIFLKEFDREAPWALLATDTGALQIAIIIIILYMPIHVWADIMYITVIYEKCWEGTFVIYKRQYSIFLNKTEFR